ncbi:2TM domain-containing protein [Maribacter sp. 2307ULW6-5]|uniref:2TM domain-containing protein n=1 Tax=Maribacter sp. 2307ULW6-5 TaxID=3386275 RepID=UPI0039BD4929
MENRNDVAYKNAQERVGELKGFYSHLMVYVLVIGVLAVFNFYTVNFPWVIFPAVGWGIGLAGHGLGVFGQNLLFGKKWEERKIREIISRNES